MYCCHGCTADINPSGTHVVTLLREGVREMGRAICMEKKKSGEPGADFKS